MAKLNDSPSSGRPPLANESYIRKMMESLKTDPRELGFAFTRWTSARLGEYLYQETGVRLTPNWIRALLLRQGLVWRRTKRTTRNLADDVAVVAAKAQLKRLKRGPLEETRPSNFGMEME